MSELKQLLTRAQVAKLLAVDPSTLSRMAKRGEGPRCIWLGGQLVRYDPDDVREYLERSRSL